MPALHCHRFRDLVALSTPGASVTTYATPEEALAFAAAIIRAAKSVKAEPFALSPDGLTYAGPVPETALTSYREYTLIRGALVKTRKVAPYEGKAVFRGYWRADIDSPWQAVCNAAGDPIAYMARDYAYTGAANAFLRGQS